MFDHQAFTIQEFGGISRYFCKLFKEFNKISEFKYHLGLKYSNNVYLKSLERPEVKPFLPGVDFKGKYRMMRFMNNQHALRHHTAGEFDLFHPTYYDPYFLKSGKDMPFVLTVHDMIHEKFTTQFPVLKTDRNTIANKRELIARARRIIAISQSTKQDIINLYDTAPDKIDIVYHASPFAFDSEPYNEDKEDFILFVGNRELYKNFSFFIEVASQLLNKYNLKLVCAGGAGFTEPELFFFRKLGVENKVVHQRVQTDETLIRLYRKAMLFVFPSIYEGFGIPILESMQLGCPALISNTSSFPEVGGDAALYFDPYEKSSLYGVMDRAIADRDLRRTLAVKGLERNKLFSWKKSAMDTILSYHRAVSEK